MFITKGHFLSPYTMVMKNSEQLGLVHSVDTDLMVAIRVVGFDEKDESPILDLVKVDEILFCIDLMDTTLRQLVPEGSKTISQEKFCGQE